ncbi:uncharacterized protein [Antedon mediterranea]
MYSHKVGPLYPEEELGDISGDIYPNETLDNREFVSDVSMKQPSAPPMKQPSVPTMQQPYVPMQQTHVPMQQPSVFSVQHPGVPIQQPSVVVQQPILTQPTVAAPGIIVQSSPQYVNSADGNWSSGLFDCCKDPVSCFGAFCCCCLYSCYLSDKLGEFFGLPCCLPGPYFITALRTKLRTKHNISGSVLSDCLTTSCFPICAMAQLSRHQDAASTNQIVRV